MKVKWNGDCDYVVENEQICEHELIAVVDFHLFAVVVDVELKKVAKKQYE